MPQPEKVILWDNGRNDSDHDIFFVSPSPLSVDEAVFFINFHKQRHYWTKKGYVLGAGELEMIHSETDKAIPLKEFTSRMSGSGLDAESAYRVSCNVTDADLDLANALREKLGFKPLRRKT